MRRILAAIVMALLLLPLAAPIVELYAASAQQASVLNVLTAATTPGSLVSFFFLRGTDFPANPVLFFFISTNGEGRITPGDQLVAEVTVGTAGNSKGFAGTIRLFSDTTPGEYYLKVSRVTLVNGSAVASMQRFRVLSPADVAKGFRLQSNATKADVENLGYYDHSFGTFALHNRIRFIVNLTALGIQAKFLSGNVPNYRVSINLTSSAPCANQSVLYIVNQSANVISNMLSSLKVDIKGAGKLLNVSGRITDFQLRCPSSVENVAGISAGFQRFDVNFAVANGTVTVPANFTIISDGKVVKQISQPENISIVSMSFGRPGLAKIFPTLIFRFRDLSLNNTNIYGLNGAVYSRINVGDRVEVVVRNFRQGNYKPGVSIYALDGAFAKLSPVNNTGVSLQVTVNGTTLPDGQFKPIGHLPPRPYGGRVVVVSLNVTKAAADPVAVPNLSGTNFEAKARVFPAIQYYAFKNNGDMDSTLNSALFVPGEVFVVRGLGFRDPGSVTVNLVNLSNGQLIPVSLFSFPNAAAAFRQADNGSFVGVYQISSKAKLFNGNTVRIRAYVGDPAGVNSHFINDTVSFPSLSDARVMIEPSVKSLSIGSGNRSDAALALGGEKVPFPAIWEEEGQRVFRLLVYGAPAATKYNVSIERVDFATIVTPLLQNVAPNGTRSLDLPKVRIPATPYGRYVAVLSTEGQTVKSSSDFEDRLRIAATAAGQDPVTGVLKKTVILPAPVNLTVVGEGFSEDAQVFYSIPTLGIYGIRLKKIENNQIVDSKTNASGSFVGFIDLASHGATPGTHTIQFYAGHGDASITVVIGAVPPFRIDLLVSDSCLGLMCAADSSVEVWVAAFYGGSLAQIAQIVSLSVKAHLVVAPNNALIAPVAVVPALGSAGTSPAVYHGLFNPTASNVFGAQAKGKAIALLAEATARFSAGAPLDRASDMEVIQVPAKSFSEKIKEALKANFSAIEALINSLSAQLSTVRSQIAANFSAVRDDVSAVRGDISSLGAGIRANLTAIRGLLVVVDQKADAQIAALVTANDRLSAISTDIRKMNASMVSGFAAVRTDIAGLAALMRAMNASLRDVIVSESGAVRAAIAAGRDAIIGVVRANASAIVALIRALDGKLESSAKSISDAIAAFRTEASGKMDSILAEVGRARTDIANVGAGVTAAQSVLAEVRTTLASVNDRVVGVRSVVDSINAAMAGVATKSDLAAARDAVNSRVASAESSVNSRVAAVQNALNEARSALESQIQSSQDALSVNARNWGLINSVLVIIAVALLAYSIFVARRP